MNTENIIELARQGNQLAIRQLYNTYSSRMIATSLKILGNYDEALEVAHDAFLLAISHLHTLKHPDRIEPWINSITHNLALRHKQSLASTTFIPLTEIADENIADNTSTNTNELPTLETILNAIEQLPNGYRNVFELAVMQDMSHREISEILHIAEHSSSSQLARAKRMLRKLLSVKNALIILLISTTIVYLFTLKNEDEKEYITIKKQTDKNNNESIPKLNIDSIYHNTTSSLKLYSLAKESSSISDSIITMNDITNDTDNLNSESCDSVTIQHHKTFNITPIQEKSTKQQITYLKSQNISKQIKWNLSLAYSGNTNNQHQYSVPLSLWVLKQEATDGPGTDLPTELIEINKWNDIINYIDWINIPNENKNALLKIAKENIRLGEQNIKQTTIHDKPITFELMLQRKINQHWSIETGLNYTSLSSRFIIGTPLASIIKHQKIDYLGIPIKGSYLIWSNNNWNTYSTLGVSLELPVKYNIATNYSLYGESLLNSTESDNIPLQWSTSIGAGIQYKITPNVGLYLEPSIRYFIPDGRSIETYRTEHPISISIPFGLRISW